MGRYKKLLSNTLILAIGTFGSKFLVFFMMPLYTGCLLPEEYSVADLVTQAANLLMPFACAGISDGIFRFTMDKASDAREVFTSGLSVLGGATVLFLCLSPLLCLFDVFDGYVLLLVVYVLMANFHAAVAQLIRAKGNTVLFSLGGIIGTVLTVAFNLLLLLVFDMGIVGYVLSVVLGDFFVTIFLFFRAGVWRDIDFRMVSAGKIKAMLKYSIPMIPTTVFWWITSVSDRYLVTVISGSEVNGLYAAAYKAPTLLTLFCTVFIEAWQFSAVDERDEKERADFFTQVFASYQGIIFMAAGALILFSKIVTKILLAEGYFDSWIYIPILSLAMTFSALTTFMGSVYLVRKKSVSSFWTAAIGAGINIALNLWWIPDYAATGAAVATFISYFVVFVIRGFHTVKLVRFHLGVPLLIFNTLVLGGMSVGMLSENGYAVWIAVGLFAALVLVNGNNILRGVVIALKNYRKKNKKFS